MAQSPVECIIDDAEPAIEPSPAIGRAAASPVASPLHHHLGEAQVVMQLVVVVKLNIWLRQATVVLNSSCLRDSAIRTGGAGQFAPLGARRPSWLGRGFDSIVVVDGRRVNRLDSAVLNNIPVRRVDKGRHFFLTLLKY